MEKQNVTLALPKELLQKAKLLAVKRKTSLSALLASTLAEVVNKDEGYDAGKQRYLKWLEEGRDLGTKGEITWTRDDLHER
ncbi:MAG: hypothetical protein KIS85_03860 [Anaerolineales bacterium]|nr:hypothetical protein [Anaerolineales bacterium]